MISLSGYCFDRALGHHDQMLNHFTVVQNKRVY